MARGEATALLVVPKGFTRAFLREERAQLTLITNPAQRILPFIVEEAASLMWGTGFYLRRLAGAELETVAAEAERRSGRPAEASVAAMSVRFYRMGENLAAWLDPLRIRLEIQAGADEKTSAQMNLGALFVPGVRFLSLLFVGQGLSMDLWRERQRGTVARRLTSPRAASLLAGKLAAAVLAFAVLSAAGLASALWVADLPWKALAPGTLRAAFSGATIFLLLCGLQMQAGSERTAHIATNLVLFPMILLGGSLFSLEVMPAWLARSGRLTPDGWALAQLRTILDGSADAARFAVGATGMLLTAAAAFGIAARQLRRRPGA